MSKAYVHRYRLRENERLQDQAGTLVDLLHSDTSYPPGSVALEAGCGVGAQTVTLAQRSPDARFTSIDVSADIFTLPFAPESFDHVFICFVLEHLSRPAPALAILGALRNAVLGLLRQHGYTNIAEALRHFAWPPGAVLQLLGLVPHY